MPKRQIFNVPLAPVAGDRFQPTGFPDLGTSTFKKPTAAGWTDCILVESEQSMANHLESVGWDSGSQEPVAHLDGLPYVRVINPGGDFLTSSRTEPHRLSSAYIRNGKLGEKEGRALLSEAFGLKDDQPISARHVAAAIFDLDPASLLHGVFFADNKIAGQPKVTRALTSFVQAEDVQRADYGGVKRDAVNHKLEEGEAGAEDGYGSIPFHRTMWTARTIVASFVLDLDQLASYGLSPERTRLLEVLGLWEVRTLLDSGLRLRTMCDLAPTDETPDLPNATELAGELRSLITETGPFPTERTPLTLTFQKDKKAKKGKSENDEGPVS